LNGTAMGLKDAMMPVFTVQRLAWTNSEYADLTSGANVTAAVCAMVFAGWLADRVGKTRIIGIYTVLIALGWTTLALTPRLWATAGYFTASIYAIQFLETFCIVAVLATAMNLCWTRVAATQFTLYMVCNNLGIVVAASLLGPLRGQLGWSAMFLLTAGLLVAVAVLVGFVHLGAHRSVLGRLEAEFNAEQGAAPVPAPVVPSDLGEGLTP
ncbi:MAG: MFS transporter, partial [Flavobacteriales bacterium]|nr:MFS transporter [Flavobacteriales bacterium]